MVVQLISPRQASGSTPPKRCEASKLYSLLRAPRSSAAMIVKNEDIDGDRLEEIVDEVFAKGIRHLVLIDCRPANENIFKVLKSVLQIESYTLLDSAPGSVDKVVFKEGFRRFGDKVGPYNFFEIEEMSKISNLRDVSEHSLAEKHSEISFSEAALEETVEETEGMIWVRSTFAKQKNNAEKLLALAGKSLSDPGVKPVLKDRMQKHQEHVEGALKFSTTDPWDHYKKLSLANDHLRNELVKISFSLARSSPLKQEIEMTLKTLPKTPRLHILFAQMQKRITQ